MAHEFSEKWMQYKIKNLMTSIEEETILHDYKMHRLERDAYLWLERYEKHRKKWSNFAYYCRYGKFPE